MSQVTCMVDGMTCGGCEQALKNVLNNHFDVVSIDHRSGQVTLDHFDQQRLPELRQRVDEAGFTLSSDPRS